MLSAAVREAFTKGKALEKKSAALKRLIVGGSDGVPGARFVRWGAGFRPWPPYISIHPKSAALGWVDDDAQC
jgi:hypothetical protein